MKVSMVRLKKDNEDLQTQKQDKHLFCSEHLKTQELMSEITQRHTLTTIYITVLTCLYSHVHIVMCDLLK